MGNHISSNSVEKEKPLLIQKYKPPLQQRVMARPFKYYWRMGGITFGLTFLSNFATTFTNKDNFKCLREHPDVYVMGLMSKSFYFGCFWPAFYVKSVTKPREVFVFGEGMRKLDWT